MTLPKITHVAIQYASTTHVRKAHYRHHHIIGDIINERGGIAGSHTEGFLDETGRFLNRTEAMNLAKANGQLNRKPGTENYQGPELYSEDLW